MSISKEMFLQVDALYQECFCEAAVPTATLEQWWQAQPNGIIPLAEGNEMIGALSYWYISASDYQQLAAGKLLEKDLVICSANLVASGIIYISEMALKSQYRKQGKSALLVQKLFEQIGKEYTWEHPLKITALGYSQEGLAVLKKMGLHKVLDAGQSVNGQAFLEMEVSNATDLE